MTNKAIYCTFLLVLGLVFNPAIQAQDQDASKQEQRFHDKENSRFVNEVESLQEDIQRIRNDKSLTAAEQKAKIKPIFERMNELRSQNVNARSFNDGSTQDQRTAKGRQRDMADSDGKQMSKRDRKSKAKRKKSEVKRMRKEIKRVKKDKSLTEVERVAKLEMLQTELKGIQSGKAKAKGMASANTPMGKKDRGGKSAEKRARDQWKADTDAKRKDKMERSIAKQKQSREVARAKREKNIKEWKARARQESGAMHSTPSMSKTGNKKSPMTQTANVNVPNQMDVPNRPVTQKKSRQTSQQLMMDRLTRMSSKLTQQKDNGLINLKHFDQKMAHIRSLREKLMRP